MGVAHPDRLVRVADKPAIENEGDNREQQTAHGAENETQRAIQRADLRVENDVGEFHRHQRHQNQRNDEHRGDGGGERDFRLADVRRDVGQDHRIEVVGRRRRRDPGQDRQHFAGEAAQHGQQTGDQNSGEHRQIKI